MGAVDEKIAAMAGLCIKPFTQGNVEDHLALIGLEPELASHTKLSQLSDGEKVKAVLGACMWMSPHIIVFDEPTNSLSGFLGGTCLGHQGIQGWCGRHLP